MIIVYSRTKFGNIWIEDRDSKSSVWIKRIVSEIEFNNNKEIDSILI